MKTKNKAEKPAAPPSGPPFEFTLRQRGAKAAPPQAKVEKRDNVFSKSRDTREDRGARQMKTKHSAQTFPHVR